MAQPSALKPSLPQAGGLFWERGRGTGSTGRVHARECRAEMLLWPRRWGVLACSPQPGPPRRVPVARFARAPGPWVPPPLTPSPAQPV